MAEETGKKTEPETEKLKEPAESEKRSGYDFWRKTLGSPRFILAPMVEMSELPWRLLSKRYGAELVYTPMLHASVFVRDSNYREANLISCKDDHPLIVQFAANDPDTFLKAAKLAEPYCVAVDLNLGCPQIIAKKGHYGAFLQDEWDLLHKMVSTCHKNLQVPITCKIRIFEDKEKTVRYAKMLESAGCQLLTVHGRTREKKGVKTGLADWSYIKAVKESVNIPVFANGNIQYMDDVHRCIKETGVDGVMTAEGNLHNPALFKGIQPLVWDMAKEYMELVKQYPCSLSSVRGHLFKLFQHALFLEKYFELRQALSMAKDMESMEKVIEDLEEASQSDMKDYEENPSKFTTDLPHPYWLCQPYVRPSPDSNKEEKPRFKREHPEPIALENGVILSRNKTRKLIRNPTKKFLQQEKSYDLCGTCPNPKSGKCEHKLCKKCCKIKMYEETMDCQGHGILIKTKKLQRDLKEKNCDDEAPKSSGEHEEKTEQPAGPVTEVSENS